MQKFSEVDGKALLKLVLVGYFLVFFFSYFFFSITGNMISGNAVYSSIQNKTSPENLNTQLAYQIGLFVLGFVLIAFIIWFIAKHVHRKLQVSQQQKFKKNISRLLREQKPNHLR